MPTRSESDAARDKEQQMTNVVILRRFKSENPTKYDALSNEYEQMFEQAFHDYAEAEVKSAREQNPEGMRVIEEKAEQRAAKGINCKFCGQSTFAEDSTPVIPKDHNEASCLCVNPHTQQVDAWRVVRHYGSSIDSINMILDSIKLRGAYHQLPPNKFNDFKRSVDEEMTKRANQKQVWLMNNRNNTTPAARSEGFQRYGPGSGQR